MEGGVGKVLNSEGQGSDWTLVLAPLPTGPSRGHDPPVPPSGQELSFSTKRPCAPHDGTQLWQPWGPQSRPGNRGACGWDTGATGTYGQGWRGEPQAKETPGRWSSQ